MHSQITTIIVGHLIAAPRQFTLRESVGCDLRVRVTRNYIDSDGISRTIERQVKVVTYDTVMAARLEREFTLGDFVEITCDDVRVERAWQNNRTREWVSGRAAFTLAEIRKVGSSARHGDQPRPPSSWRASPSPPERAAPGDPHRSPGAPCSLRAPCSRLGRRGYPHAPGLPASRLRSVPFRLEGLPLWTMTGCACPSPALRTPSPLSPDRLPPPRLAGDHRIG